MGNTHCIFPLQQPPPPPPPQISAANQLPEPRVEDRLPEPGPSSHDFARNLIWTFEDLRMLVGSDMHNFPGTSK